MAYIITDFSNYTYTTPDNVETTFKHCRKQTLVVYGNNIDQSLQNINASSSKQCLVSGTRIAAYNLATERLIAA